jgi:hypothetical protein
MTLNERAACLFDEITQWGFYRDHPPERPDGLRRTILAHLEAAAAEEQGKIFVRTNDGNLKAMTWKEMKDPANWEVKPDAVAPKEKLDVGTVEALQEVVKEIIHIVLCQAGHGVVRIVVKPWLHRLLVRWQKERADILGDDLSRWDGRLAVHHIFLEQEQEEVKPDAISGPVAS